MNNQELAKRVHSAMASQCHARGYASPVDVLMDVGVLSKANYENWRRGQVDYLERVCTANLSKLSFIMHEIRSYATKNNLKPSLTVYKQGGTKQKRILRFCKSGSPAIEKAYATHRIDSKRIAQLKEQRTQEKANNEEMQ